MYIRLTMVSFLLSVFFLTCFVGHFIERESVCVLFREGRSCPRKTVEVSDIHWYTRMARLLKNNTAKELKDNKNYSTNKAYTELSISCSTMTAQQNKL